MPSITETFGCPAALRCCDFTGHRCARRKPPNHPDRKRNREAGTQRNLTIIRCAGGGVSEIGRPFDEVGFCIKNKFPERCSRVQGLRLSSICRVYIPNHTGSTSVYLPTCPLSIRMSPRLAQRARLNPKSYTHEAPKLNPKTSKTLNPRPQTTKP